ncbi:MAG: DUF4392 domain-containing protein [Thermomicrobiales bacterium]|nr:DUF4392 domain-containing protein [Thermomicrobiales bacterium]
MDKDQLLERNVGESLDALVSLDVRAYGVPGTLYAAARAASDGPLIMEAAKALVGTVGPDDCVVVATGFVFPPWKKGELDGVVGAAAIARALEVALKVKPILTVEPELVPALINIARVAGLQPVLDTETFVSQPHTALIVGFPKDVDDARTEATRVMETLHPKAIISIERPGRDSNGVYHMGSAADVTDLAAKIDIIFEAVAASGGLTVAIGDLGNELGLGSLRETVSSHIPYGDEIAAAVSADKVITAAVSDWAGYALAAAIAFQTRCDDAYLTPWLLEQLMVTAVNSDLIDGSGYSITAVDGVDLTYNKHLTSMLEAVCRMPLRSKDRFARMFEMKIELDSRSGS